MAFGFPQRLFVAMINPSGDIELVKLEECIAMTGYEEYEEDRRLQVQMEIADKIVADIKNKFPGLSKFIRAGNHEW